MSVQNDALFIGELRSKYAASDTANFCVSDFLAAFGSPLDTVMYLRLLWPEFIRFEGMVFREETLEDDEDRRRVYDTLTRYSGDRTKTEQSFNLVEIPSGIFTSKAFESSDDVDEFLAEKLVELWSYRLAATFPEEHFVVKTLPAEETGGETGVIFYVRRSTA
jgi:hypothetical protein